METNIKPGDRVFLVQERRQPAPAPAVNLVTYQFKVKEDLGGDIGGVYLAAESTSKEPLLWFRLAPGTSLDDAHRLARLLNVNVAQVGIVRFEQEAFEVELPFEGPTEGVVDHLGVDPIRGPFFQLTDGRVVPLGTVCLLPEGHVFAADLGTAGEPNPCLACGCEIAVPYRGRTCEEEGDADQDQTR